MSVRISHGEGVDSISVQRVGNLQIGMLLKEIEEEIAEAIQKGAEDNQTGPQTSHIIRTVSLFDYRGSLHVTVGSGSH